MAAKRQARTQQARADKAKPAAESAVDKEPAQAEDQEPRFDVEIYRDWCKGCGICVAFCPQEVLGMNEMGQPEVIRPEACTGCGWCELRCPDFAISIRKKKKSPEVCDL
ncbi:MAG: ferredoxin family protein [Syntrophobacteria bacterium]